MAYTKACHLTMTLAKTPVGSPRHESQLILANEHGNSARQKELQNEESPCP